MSNLATLRPNVFSSTNQPKNRHRGPYLLPILKKLCEKKINFEDPETKLLVQGKIKDVLMLRLILNGTEGETKAIVEILDRLDGKVKEAIKVDDNEQLLDSEIELIGNGNKPSALKRYKGLID